MPAPAVAIAAALVCAALAAYLAMAARDERTLQRANALGAQGDAVGALRLARSVERAPATTRAHLTAAYAALAAGRPAEAITEFAAAARRDPDDWVIHRDWALALAATGQRDRAARRMTRAAQLNPRLRVPPGFP